MFPNGIFGNLIQSLDGIVQWIENVGTQIQNLFADVDFTILYDWLPTDVQTVVTAVIGVLLVLAVFGLIRRVLFFLG